MGYTTSGEFNNQDLATIWESLGGAGGGGGLQTFFSSESQSGASSAGMDVAAGKIVVLRSDIGRAQYDGMDMLQIKNLNVMINFNTKTYSQVFGTSGFFATIDEVTEDMGYSVGMVYNPVDLLHVGNNNSNRVVYFHEQCDIRSIGQYTKISFPDFYIRVKDGNGFFTFTLVTQAAIAGNSLPAIQSTYNYAMIGQNSNIQL